MTDARDPLTASESPPQAEASVTDTRRGGVSGAALLLEPHQDDAILFASFTCLRHRPDVVTVLGDARNQPGVTGAMRDEENARAFRELGLDPPVAWPYRDDAPEWDDIVGDLEALRRRGYTDVFAPWPEPGGHPQHNRVGELAIEVFGAERVTCYTTYRFGGPKTRGPVEVEELDDWIIRKLRALACFESQILHGPRRFFMEDLREYRAPAPVARARAA